MEICRAVLSIFFAICIGINNFGLSDAAGIQCEVTSPEAAWLEDCNWCSCVKTDDVAFAACTLMACHPGFKPEGSGECKGDAKWKRDCNWCSCVDEQASCSKKLCRTAKQFAPAPGATSERHPECAENGNGFSYKNDCNTCTCISFNSAVCTRRACINRGRTGKQLNQNSGSHRDQSSECRGRAVGESFQKECNTCTCTETGIAVCTLKLCLQAVPVTPGRQAGSQGNRPDLINKSPECEAETEGASFSRDCNTCHCTSTGVAVCTTRACLDRGQREGRQAEGCAGRITWKKDCNTCRCNNGVAVCTKKLCRPSRGKELQDQDEVRSSKASKATCEGRSKNSWWMNGCDKCSCSTDSNPVCEREGGCVGTDSLVRQAGECDGDVSWKKECNWCSCINGRAICQRTACADDEGTSRALLTDTSITNTSECVITSDGASWRNICNWCSCSGEQRAICTRRACPPDFESRDQAAKECEGDASWKKDCNWCNCVNEKAVCSKKTCKGEIVSKDEEVIPDPKPVVDAAENANISKPVLECTEGSRWRVDCNWCFCSNDLGACTLRGCFGGGVPSSQPECKDVSEWRRREKDSTCSWCVCKDEKAICSPIPCEGNCLMAPANNRGGRNDAVQSISPRSDAFTENCQAGASWIEGCNTCFCSEGAAYCTQMQCIEGRIAVESTALKTLTPDIESLVSEYSRADDSECTEGSRWKKNCNWCRCYKGRGSCSKRLCPPGPEDLTEPLCDGHSHWKQDCNRCSCYSGIPLCTKMRCLPPPEPEEKKPEIPSSVVDCVGGSRWRIKCNWCNCNNGSSTCTQQLCLKDPPTSEPECEENSEWKNQETLDKCSWCTCVEGNGVCSPIPCGAGREAVASDKASGLAVNKGIDCTDGSRWRIDCNWCNCGNNLGACTMRGCMPGATSTESECVGNSEWKKYEKGNKCSWCTCQDEKAICNPISSCTYENLSITPGNEQLQATDDSVCTEGSSWRVKCNWCHCSNGQGICSLVACLSGPDKSTEDECKVESRWKNDCNWCICVAGRSVCEQKACAVKASVSPPSDEGKREQGCVADNTWTEDCNVCMCISGVSVCTKKACVHVSRTDDVCDKGVDYSWKVECNTCKCIEGQTACTHHLCDGGSLRAHPPACYLPIIKPGAEICGGFDTKWTFNADKNTCEAVVYGGCGGSENLFHTNEECQLVCEGKLAQTIVSPNTKERCYLPKDVGSCFALITRFMFNKETQRCESFMYGGCRGNQNNFMSAEECFDICGGNPPAAVSTCDRSQCGWKRFSHYLAKDCLPIYEGGSCCPTKFTCKSEIEAGKNQDRCYYKNKEYGIKEAVPVEDPCERSCFCGAPNAPGQPAKITCAHVECPSNFQEPDPNCRFIYKEGSCCSVDKVCKEPNALPELERQNAGCEWNGQKWLDGDKMYFDDLPCHSCICTSGFTGPEGPGCQRVDCGLEFRYRSELNKGCTPVFFEERCCPIGWFCPNDKRLQTQLPEVVHPEATLRSATCNIGNISLKVDEAVPISDCRLKCKCDTPPDITCVQYRTCDLAAASLEPANRTDANCREEMCSSNCRTEIELSTGCPSCICSNAEFSCQEPVCPPLCLNGTIAFDERIGCKKCQCQCNLDFSNKPHCPLDCIVRIRFDKQSGCEVCECDPEKKVFNQG